MRAGIIVERAYAGTFLSALEMAGVSLSVLEVDDVRLARLDAQTAAPAWPNAAPRSRVEPVKVEAPVVEAVSHTVGVHHRSRPGPSGSPSVEWPRPSLPSHPA